MSSLPGKLVSCIALTLLAAFVPASVAASPSRAKMPTRASSCQRVASAHGSDSNAGTRQSPFATVSRLVGALRPGEVGCLLSGRYRTDVHLTRRGRQNARLTLRAAPGASVTICGFVVFQQRAAYWSLRRLTVDGSCSAQNTIQIYGDGAVVDHVDVTNRHHAQSCIMIGNATDSHPRGIALHHDRIHDCGSGGSRFFHGIYANSPSHARITDNFVYGNTGFGIHLYPDAQSTIVKRNVVDGNLTGSGLIFAGAGHSASAHNLVEHNVFSGNGAYGVSSSWGGTVGAANVLVANCFWGNARGRFDPGHLGFRPRRNIDSSPGFVGTSTGDYRIRPASRCSRMQPRGHVGP